MLLCASVSHLCNGTTNSLPTVVIVKIIIFTNPLNTTGKYGKKKYVVKSAQFRQLHQADHGCGGTTVFKTGHAGKSTRRHTDTAIKLGLNTT